MCLMRVSRWGRCGEGAWECLDWDLWDRQDFVTTQGVKSWWQTESETV